MQHSDQEILQLFRQPSTREAAFRLLMEKFQERLYWHIRRMVSNHEDANDVLQDVFVRAWKGLENFRGEAQIYTWLYRIASNESITFLNKRKKRAAVPIENEDYDMTDYLHADEPFDGDEAQRKLKMAIDSLPEKQKLVFNMRYYEEMKYQEMSEVLETSVGALKASYHHAVKKIECFFSED